MGQIYHELLVLSSPVHYRTQFCITVILNFSDTAERVNEGRFAECVRPIRSNIEHSRDRRRGRRRRGRRKKRRSAGITMIITIVNFPGAWIGSSLPWYVRMRRGRGRGRGLSHIRHILQEFDCSSIFVRFLVLVLVQINASKRDQARKLVGTDGRIPSPA